MIYDEFTFSLGRFPGPSRTSPFLGGHRFYLCAEVDLLAMQDVPFRVADEILMLHCTVVILARLH
jgi:hypothetical protein